jgi:hypothetical protein
MSLLGYLGCSSNDGSKPQTTSELLAPPPNGQGIQLKMASTLDAGVETERCMFYKVGADGLAVNHEEVRYTPGSHHVLLYVTPYTDIPTQDRFGNAVDTSGIFECGPKGPTSHWQVNGVAGGAQIADGPPIVDDLPSGVAFVIPAGTILLMNTHYLNATGQALQTDARINLYTIASSEVTTEAGILFWYDPIIYIPSQEKRSAREVCPIRTDIQLVNAQSHMHRRGIGYVARELDTTGAPAGELYRGTEWEEVALTKFQPTKHLSAGQSVDFQCNYSNTTDHTIIQGLSTADEMCMFLGLYYPKDRQTELCGLNADWSGAFWGATWFGEGTADGATTATCLNSAKPKSVDNGASFYACMDDSCPAIGVPMSNAARCLATNGLGACSNECGGTDATTCQTCVAQNCGTAMQALATATCS